jgi:hypothetical protein
MLEELVKGYLLADMTISVLYCYPEIYLSWVLRENRGYRCGCGTDEVPGSVFVDLRSETPRPNSATLAKAAYKSLLF